MTRWRFGVLLWLLAARLALADPALPVPPISISPSTQQYLQAEMVWCETPRHSEDTALTPPLACAYQVRDSRQLPRGFSQSRHWVAFALHNPAETNIERWLQVGHPRQQEVNLWHQQDGHWQVVRSGQSVARAQRPLITQRLLLPVRLQAEETAEFYLEVFTPTNVDLRLTLWELPDYFAQEARLQILQSLGMGGLMLAAAFTLLIYSKQRQAAMLWLLASYVVEILLDASYTGLLSAYFWPAHWPYELRLHGVFAGLTIVFFTLFVRDFLQTRAHFPQADWLLRLSLGMLALALFGLVWEYHQPIRLIALAALLSMSVSILLFFRAWRQGSGPAGYLLLSYLLLLVMIIYRVSNAFGWVSNLPLKELGYSWYFLLITPTTLLGILKRSEALREDLIRAEADRQAQSRFLAQMSHELRSPLNSVISHARLLQRQLETDQIKIKVEVGHILASGQRLLGMIDEILEYARLQAGALQLNLDPLDLREFLGQLTDDQVLAAGKVGNHFALHGLDTVPETVIADERRLRQVLDNLLSNAHRYCRDGQVSLSVTSIHEREDGGTLSFSVEDSGPGIPIAEQEAIFLPFHRGSQAKRQGIDGVGVGLTIARQLVQLMGGELRLSSQPGQGSRFCFQIPYQQFID